MAKILLDDEPLATRFLDTLMNQLNWSFSEFVGIMQEVGGVYDSAAACGIFLHYLPALLALFHFFTAHA